VNEAVRTAFGQRFWNSEKNAIKDTAFEAYLALYKAGLVNDNMLPLLRHGIDEEELTSTKIETQASLKMVAEQLNPWVDVAKFGAENGYLFHYTMTVGGLDIEVSLPVELPAIPPFQLYWDSNTELEVKFASSRVISSQNYRKSQEDTHLLLEATFGYRFPIERKKHVILFSTKADYPLKCRIDETKATDDHDFDQHPSWTGLIRDQMQKGLRYIYVSSLSNKPPIECVKQPYREYETAPDSAHLSLKRLTRRANFLHKVLPSNNVPSSKPFAFVLPTSRCTVDRIPFVYVQTGLFIPSIIHRLEVHLIAEMLSKSILKKVEISDLGLVRTAICASSANEDTNYQRLEFLGDSILKLCASIQLIAAYPLWHEGYLSAKKDRNQPLFLFTLLVFAVLGLPNSVSSSWLLLFIVLIRCRSRCQL
jgi:hypothetical protein